MKDIAADKAEPAFEIERGMDLPSEHGLGETWSVRIHGRNDLVRRFVSLIVPASTRAKIVAEMLAEERCDVFSPWARGSDRALTGSASR